MIILFLTEFSAFLKIKTVSEMNVEYGSNGTQVILSKIYNNIRIYL